MDRSGKSVEGFVIHSVDPTGRAVVTAIQKAAVQRTAALLASEGHSDLRVGVGPDLSDAIPVAIWLVGAGLAPVKDFGPPVQRRHRFRREP